MKRQPVRFLFSKATSFTLVELLVVIGIIAILASVVLAGANQVIKKAQRTKAATMANSIHTGVVSYYTEYSVYPIPSSLVASPQLDIVIGDTSTTDAGNWAALIYGLCGNINPGDGTNVSKATGSSVSNTRGIAFLTMKKSDVSTTTGAPLNPLPTGSGANASNLYFNIAIDGDYDGVLGVSPSAVLSMPNLSAGTSAAGGISTSGVAVWANCNGSASSTNANFWVSTY